MLLYELGHLLKPGGLLILVEFDLYPLADGRTFQNCHESGLPGWFALWDTYRSCLKRGGVDIDTPKCMERLLDATGKFDRIVAKKINIPIGFFPKGFESPFPTLHCWPLNNLDNNNTDPLALTIGQLAWMSFDLYLIAMKPFFFIFRPFITARGLFDQRCAT